MSLKITSYLVLPLNRAKFKTMTMLYKFTVKRLNNNNKQTVKSIVKFTLIATKIPYQCLCLFYNFCHLGFFLKAKIVFCLFVCFDSQWSCDGRYRYVFEVILRYISFEFQHTNLSDFGGWIVNIHSYMVWWSWPKFMEKWEHVPTVETNQFVKFTNR